MTNRIAPHVVRAKASLRAAIVIVAVATAITAISVYEMEWMSRSRAQPLYSALSTFRTQNLLVDDTSVLTGKTSIQDLALGPAQYLGQLAPDTIFNDWLPDGWLTHSLFVVKASDDSGTRFSGFSSVGVAIGDIKEICNVDSKADAGVISFLNESSTVPLNSLAANRILTPNGGETPVAARAADFYIASGECARFQYQQIEPSDPTVHRWVVMGGHRRFSNVLSQAYQIYNGITVAPITGQVDNYLPVGIAEYNCAVAYGSGAGSGSAACGEAGNDLTWQANTIVHLQTSDSTGAIVTGFVYTGSQNPNDEGPIKIVYNDGPGPITFKSESTSDTINQIAMGNSDNRYDVVINSGRPPLVLWHRRDTGRWIVQNHRDYMFDERDVTINKGMTIAGGIPSQPTLGLQITAAVGVYMGLGVTLPYIYGKATDIGFGGPVGISGNITIAGGGFDDTSAVSQIADVGAIGARHVPTANHGTVSADATNFMGRVTSIGANTSVVLTFANGGFAHSSHCFIQTEGSTALVLTDTPTTSPSTTHTITCFDMAGVAANCADFSYECWGHN